VRALRASDGPNGVRGRRFFNGVPSSCFPCGTGLAASFDLLRAPESLVSSCTCSLLFKRDTHLAAQQADLVRDRWTEWRTRPTLLQRRTFVVLPVRYRARGLVRPRVGLKAASAERTPLDVAAAGVARERQYDGVYQSGLQRRTFVVLPVRYRARGLVRPRHDAPRRRSSGGRSSGSSE
jgi:hypothetical protein